MYPLSRWPHAGPHGAPEPEPPSPWNASWRRSPTRKTRASIGCFARSGSPTSSDSPSIAKQRGEPLDHILLCGPPGLGKTTLAYILAREMGTNLHVTSGPAIEHKGTLTGELTRLERGDVLFIDEIHRLSAPVEEALYPAIEEFRVDVVTGEGVFAESISVDVRPFTLVGATTRAGLLTKPLHERFGVTLRLDFYSVDDLQQIVARSASLMGVSCEPEGARELASRSRGTPRIANRLLRRVRDFAEVEGRGVIDSRIVKHACDRLAVDPSGLD